MNVRKTTCNAMVYGELGKYPTSTHVKTRMLNYWLRLITGKQDKICYVMYQCLLRLYNEHTFKPPWLDYIRKLLDHSGMSWIWVCQEINNPLWVKLAYERNVKDQWITEWWTILNSKSSCSSYVSYKDSFTLEKYLVKLSKQHRTTLSKLRTNNHRLPVVTGRFNRTPREERYCNKCSDHNAIGDEYHVLLECNNQDITELRNQYLPLYYRNNPNRYKFVQLLKDTRHTTLCKIALFVKSVFNIFR